MKQKLILLLILLVFTGFMYRNWFAITVIANGDFLGPTVAQLQHILLMPFAWDPTSGNGLGQFASPFSWLFFIMVGPQFILGKLLGFNWSLVERFAYLYPLIILLLVMPIFLYKKLFPKSNFYLIASLVFAFNTYILMLTGGGQIYIALSYSLAPLILGYYVSKLKGEYSLFSSLVLSLLLSLEVMLDLRITYVLLLGVFLFVLFLQLFSKESVSQRIKMILFLFVIPAIFTGLAQAFWVLPTILMHQNPANQLGAAYNSISAVNFFSFAKFEDTIGFLHPNWPENIFGKVGFMKPEFLLLPILAFGSLLFIGNPFDKLRTNENLYIPYFVILGVLGAFLAKGAQDPFGRVYLWLFLHIPGFVMFRDPTKWYLLIAISYSVLIPFSIEKIYGWLQTKKKFLIFNFKFLIKSKYLNVQNIFLLLVFAYLLFLIRPALVGQLTGTFRPHEIPQEYVRFENFLSKQNWGRTFWIPSVQRYAYNTPQHSAVGAEDLLQVTSVNGAVVEFRKQITENKLQQAGVRYVVVPYDSEGEIFLKDRKYDNSQYIRTIHSLQAISWLHQIPGFGRIAVFAMAYTKDHFWSTNSQMNVSYTEKSPIEYTVKISNAKNGDEIIFSENFDTHWQAKMSNTIIMSKPFENTYNSFILPKNGTYSLTVFYEPQKWVEVGLWISVLSFAYITVFLILNFVYTKSNGKKAT